MALSGGRTGSSRAVSWADHCRKTGRRSGYLVVGDGFRATRKASGARIKGRSILPAAVALSNALEHESPDKLPGQCPDGA